MNRPVPLALIGIGAIARAQHIPTLAAGSSFEIAALIDPDPIQGSAPCFASLEDALAADIAIDAVSLCVPPQARAGLAQLALDRGLHVMLEKPPGATVSEVEALRARAYRNGVALFASWHSRMAPGVEPTQRWLANKRVEHVSVVWKEDVRKWHPRQEWLWQPGGMGVFDPGINALSILTEILPEKLSIASARLQVPANRAAPIAARLQFDIAGRPAGEAEMDFRETGGEVWDIVVETSGGTLELSRGGAELRIDGKRVAELGSEAEYPALYTRFRELVAAGESDVDLAPMQLVADAFLLARRETVEPFEY